MAPCGARGMTSVIAAFFPTRTEGQAARAALFDEGFTEEQVSYLAETGGDSEPAAALPQGMIAVVLPGKGTVIAAGPVAEALGGLGQGSGVQGVLTVLRDQGLPDADAETFHAGIRRGGSLVSVRGISGDEAVVARDILDRNGAAGIRNAAG
jgi:hypothetical protein